MEARCHWIATPAGRLHVEEWGPPDGRVLLLLHHGGDGFAHGPWPAPFPDLITAAPPWRLLRVDRLGYGLSDPRPAGFPAGFFQTDLEQLELVLQALAPAGPLTLAGTSDGGTLALLAAARWPERVAGVAVEGAHYRTEPASMIPTLLDMQRRFQEKHGPPHAAEPPQHATLRAWFSGWLEICAQGWSIAAELAAVRCPVTVLQGELDGVVEDRHAFELAALLGGPTRVRILPGGAHLSQRSHPEAWADWLLEFLGDPPGADSRA
ncbi:MAG: alpha/beta hydrolase [Candidatus Delongbacteria bacterium]